MLGAQLAPSWWWWWGANFRLVLELAGANVLTRPPTARDAHETIVVASEKEGNKWERLREAATRLVLRLDHMLDCVLKQRFDVERGRLY